MTKAKMLRERLNSRGVIMAPGAYDVWSARLVEKAGFKVPHL